MAIVRPDFHHILCLGPVLIDRISLPGHDEPLVMPGGNATIFGATAARMGLNVSVCGQIGDDEHGKIICETLHRFVVDLSHLQAMRDTASKVVNLKVAADGEWIYRKGTPERFPYLSADSRPPDIDAFMHLHLAGINSLLRVAPETTQEIVDEFRQVGKTVSMTLNRFTNQEAIQIGELIDESDLVFCSLAEFNQLLGISCASLDEVLARIVDFPTDYCVVTLGVDGAVMKWADNNPVHQPAPATQVINTIGAGDILCAVFFSSLNRQLSPVDSLQIAVHAASDATQYPHWRDWLAAK